MLKRQSGRRILIVTSVVAGTLSLLGYTADAVITNNGSDSIGYVEPASTAQLNFVNDGPVVELAVQPGTYVHAGQVLARQDSSVADAKLAADQATLAADQEILLEAQGSPLRPAQSQLYQDQVNAAAGQVHAADIGQSDQANVGRTQIQAAQSALTSAQTALAADQQTQQSLATGCNAALGTLSATPAPAVPTAPTLPSEPASRGSTTTPTASPPTTAPSSGSSAQGGLVSVCVNAAQRITTDQSQVTQDQAAIQQVQASQATDADKAAATLSAAQSALAVARDNQAIPALPQTPAVVATDQANVAKDQAAITADQVAIQESTLVASADGVVSAVGGTVGEIATQNGMRTFNQTDTLPQQPSSGIELFPQQATGQNQQPDQYTPLMSVDSMTLKVVAQVSENAVSKVHVGQTAQVSLPAMPGHKFSTIVQRIEPHGLSVSGKVYYLVDLSVLSMPSGTAHPSSPYDFLAASMTDQQTRGFFVGLTADVHL